ncbi:MAG: hypothetical protein KKG01_02805, partial [Candidatus Omnitrophica bacterium]|nr:hypothetical protein [Candidatus Omnitrophota bacterium]
MVSIRNIFFFLLCIGLILGIGNTAFSLSQVDMPDFENTNYETSMTGEVTMLFAGGAILNANSLAALWAEVKYGGTTQYWNIGTGAITADSRGIRLVFGPEHDGKTYRMKFYGFDNSGEQTNKNRSTYVTVYSAPSSVVIPEFESTTYETNMVGEVTLKFTAGKTLNASSLSKLWAEVVEGSVTEHWDLGTDIIMDDGTGLEITFAPEHDSKTYTMSFYGFDPTDKRTNTTVPVDVTVQSEPSPVSIPDIQTGPYQTNIRGEITLAFTAGQTVNPNDFSGLWAEVEDSSDNIEYWDIGLGAFTDNNDGISIQFQPKHNASTYTISFYGFDTYLEGRRIANTNKVDVAVQLEPSPVS